MGTGHPSLPDLGPQLAAVAHPKPTRRPRRSSARVQGPTPQLNHLVGCVDLVHLYSKRETEAARLRLVLSATATPRPPEPKRHRRQRQHRLSMTEITKLIKKYEQQVPVKELAEQFGIHRTTVTAILQWQRAG